MEIKLSKKNLWKTNQGVFEGWGSSLCWWANRIGGSWILTKRTAELFYGKDGLALNIMRYNIGGGDDPSHQHITRTDSRIPGWTRWNPHTEEFEFCPTQDSRQINVLKACYSEAQKHCGERVYVEAFSNSAPYYMTRSGCSSGAEDGSSNNLREECYGVFAEYLAEVCAWLIGREKVEVRSIAAMNEPNTPFWHALSSKQEGCHFNPGDSQSRMLLETKRAFTERGLGKIEVTASDETGTRQQLLACESYSDEAWRIIDRISTHTYETERRKELGDDIARRGMNLWMSEVDGGFTAGEGAGEMAAGLGLARKIIEDLNELRPSAWVLWQLIDSHISKNGFMGNKDFGMPDLQGGYWGVAVADHDREEIILTRKYYVFGQFTKFLRPGCRLLYCGENAIAGWEEITGRLCVVAVNVSADAEELRVHHSEFGIEAGNIWRIRTSGGMKDGENWRTERIEGSCQQGILEDELPPYSVTTYVMDGTFTLSE